MILDTNALFAAGDGHPGVTEILSRAQQIALPVVAIGEYRYGIAQSRHKARCRQWLQDLIADCHVLDITDETTPQYAHIQAELKQAGTPIPTNDPWIAALCRQMGLPLLSRDRHFDVVQRIQRIGW